MEQNGEGREGLDPTRQRSGSSGATPTDIQEGTLRRASLVTYRRYSSTVGPQEEESIPGDPVAFRREDYLSRPSWLFDIGRYPVTLCPHFGDDGVPQKTPSGAPIYATEERNVRRPSWLIDTSQCAHIVHYGARRKSSTGAPYFVPADQAGRRSSELSDTGQFPAVPSVSTADDRGRRKSSLTFATEGGHLHSPSWLDNTDKYMANVGSPMLESGAPRRPSTGIPTLGPPEEQLRRPSTVSEKESAPSSQEPRKRSTEAPALNTQNEPQPEPSGALDKYPPIAGPHSENGAPLKTPTEAPVLESQNHHHLRKVSWVAEQSTTPSSSRRVDRAPQKPPMGTPVSTSQEGRLRRLSWLKEKYPFMANLHLGFGALQKPSKGAPVGASQEDYPPRSYWISDNKWKNIVYPHSVEEDRSSAVSPDQKQHLPHSPSPVSSDEDLVISEATRPSPGAQMKLSTTVHADITDNVASGKTGKSPKPASPIPFAEDRDSGNLAARKYSAARDTKAEKGKVSGEVSETMRPDLSPRRVSKAPAARRKMTAEDKQPLGVVTHFKKGHQGKQRKQSLTPIFPTTQTLQGQGSKTLLMKPPASSPIVENQVSRKATTKTVSSMDDVQLGMTSSKITKRVSFDLSPSKTEDQATARDAANELKWGKGASASSFQTAKEETSSTQAAQATLGVEDLKEAGTVLFSKIEQETESPQSAVATPVDIQSAGTPSTSQDTTVVKATETTKVPEQIVSPTKLAGKSTPSLLTKAKELILPVAVSENIFSVLSDGLLAASDSLETKEPTPVKDDLPTKYVLQTLHIGRVKLLPTMFQPEKFKWKVADECDLEIKGINIRQNLPQRQKPQARTKPRGIAQKLTISRGKPHEVTKPKPKLEELTNQECSQSWSQSPPSSSHSSISSELQNPNDWVYSKELPIECPLSQIESTNQKDKNQGCRLHKLPQLNENTQQKRLETLKRIFSLEKKILLHHQLQQNKK